MESGGKALGINRVIVGFRGGTVGFWACRQNSDMAIFQVSPWPSILNAWLEVAVARDAKWHDMDRSPVNLSNQRGEMSLRIWHFVGLLSLAPLLFTGCEGGAPGEERLLIQPEQPNLNLLANCELHGISRIYPYGDEALEFWSQTFLDNEYPFTNDCVDYGPYPTDPIQFGAEMDYRVTDAQNSSIYADSKRTFYDTQPSVFSFVLSFRGLNRTVNAELTTLHWATSDGYRLEYTSKASGQFYLGT